MYLGVLVQEVVTLNVKWIASCLGSGIEQFTLPLNTTKCVQMAMISSNKIHFICIERWIFQHFFDHIIAIALRMSSLPVIIQEASLSKSGTNSSFTIYQV